MRIVVFFSVCLWIVQMPVMAAAQEPGPKLLHSDVKWRSEVPTSGSTFVAASTATGKETSPVGSEFEVFVDPAHGARLCTSVVSRDGRYHAVIHHDVAGLKAGRYRIKIPSTHLDKLGGYSGRDVAITARLQADCAVPQPSTLLPVARPGEAVGWPLRLAIQALGNQVMLDAPVQGACQAIPDTAAVSSAAFDTECRMSMSSSGAVQFRLKVIDIAGESVSDSMISLLLK